MPKTSYFSFGFGQKNHFYPGSYVKIITDSYEKNREEMIRRYGTEWSMQYDGEKGREIVEKWDWIEIK